MPNPSKGQTSHAYQPRWTLEDIPFADIQRNLIVDQDFYFYILTSASFVEITSDLYARNLIDLFTGEPEIQQWLETRWQHEELQHGAALRQYVAAVWPEFDWDHSYQNFFSDYSRFCKVELLNPTRTLEMVARCIVETGTCTLYTMLNQASPEPVLKDLTGNIRTDEAYHYKHFYNYFRRLSAHDHPPRRRILSTLISRIREINGEDAFFAFKHAYLSRYPGREFSHSTYRNFTHELRTFAKQYYPYRMATNMGTKPLNLAPRVQRLIEPMVREGMRWLT